MFSTFSMSGLPAQSGPIALGKTNAEIADALHVSEETVKTHRKNLNEQVGCAHCRGACEVRLGPLLDLIRRPGSHAPLHKRR